MSKPQLPQGYEARRIAEIREIDDALLAALHGFSRAVHLEQRPDETFKPLEEYAIDIRHMLSEMENWTTVVTDARGQLVATAGGGVERTGDNEHLFWVDLDVLAEHRRKGIGRWLLGEAAVAAQEAGATVLSTWSNSRVPTGEAFARAHELEAKQVNRESELDLAKVDWDMVDQWVAEGPGRAPGYELVLIEGVYPEDHYDNVIAWWNIMNTAPRDDLTWNDDHLTKERLAEREANFRLSEGDRWEYIARHVESGECVGVSNVWLSPWNPTVINQGDTGVHPDHRGHALGKWLKAAMLQKIRRERPEARKVRTENAFSNDAMLGINNQLGFAESRADTIWEIPVEKALKLLT